MKKTLALVTIAMCLFLVVSLSHASIYEGTVQFTCTDFTAAGTGACILNRDNTGTGEERLRIDVTDGNGVVIYTFTFQNSLGTYAAGLIDTTPYTVAPSANPITFTLTSLAGNGLLQHVDYTQQGMCQGLVSVPTMNEWGMIIFMALAGLGAVYYLRRQKKATT
jgi:hypothetical protein